MLQWLGSPDSDLRRPFRRFLVTWLPDHSRLDGLEPNRMRGHAIYCQPYSFDGVSRSHNR